MISKKIAFLAFMAISSFSLASTIKPIEQEQVEKFYLQEIIHTQVLQTLKHSNQFDGLQEEISKIYDILAQKGVLELSGTDQEIRPYFVALQGIIEHVLASLLQKDVKSLTGYIHTPMPATPLCTLGEISPRLVDPKIEMDPARLSSVKARVTILRDYLAKGGNLYIVYPKDGFSRRTEKQQEIYKQELANYPNHLFDVPLNQDHIPEDLIGATYFFQDTLGNTFVFAIKMTQANDPKDIGNFGLWLGPINHPSIVNRILKTSEYIKNFN